MGQPGKLVGVNEIVSGLEKLGESPEVTDPLRQYLRPALATLPMYDLINVVSSVCVCDFQEDLARAGLLW